jgi:hypothetical protein
VIPVYAARKFKIVVEDSVWQPVECEHCRLEWAFRVRIGGMGKGESPYMLDNEGAKERAAKRARLALEEDRQLASEGVTRNVRCPGCGRYQSEMVRSLRASHGSSWGVLGMLGLLLGGMLVLRGLTGEGNFGSDGVVWIACGVVPIAAGVGALAWRRRLRQHYDPNAKPAIDAGPDVITRLQYEEACADALAQGTEPLPPIRWSATRDPEIDGRPRENSNLRPMV